MKSLHKLITVFLPQRVRPLRLRTDSSIWQMASFVFLLIILSTLAGQQFAFSQTIASGIYHSLSVCPDKTARSWGLNNYGQLGDGTTTNRLIPVQVSGLTGITAIATGYNHSLFVKNDGTVWACGRNFEGQIGDGTKNTNRLVPVQVSGLTGITVVAGGGAHSLFVKNDGTVWACGWNNYSQLGDGTTTDRLTPVQVGFTFGGGIATVAGGFHHSVFLKSDGTVWACGRNTDGQLGNGNNTNSNVPLQITGLCGPTAVNDVSDAFSMISLYPNPSSGKFQLTIGNWKSTNGKIEIYNTMGEKVFQSPIRQLRNSTIDVSNQPDGIYFINIKTEKESFTKKLIISR